MLLLSDYKKDSRTRKPEQGSYEWWYFDAIDNKGRYKMVVIFYEGNPFSSRYIKELNGSGEALAEYYPAVSISIYDRTVPIYYSFTEFERDQCRFDAAGPSIRAESHRMTARKEGAGVRYRLKLEEMLPSGDGIQANILFESREIIPSLFHDEEKRGGNENHIWNLVQPRAEVEGTLNIYSAGEKPERIDFTGTGYHDHNTGMEPLAREFEDWYWGRFHFREVTLVYFIGNGNDESRAGGWLIDNRNTGLAGVFGQVEVTDESYSLWGLRSGRKIKLKGNYGEAVVQQSAFLDNGPFYQRFSSDAIFQYSNRMQLTAAGGISEYIRPGRISNLFFRPFVDMRIRYTARGAHWVQKSKKLYRWTW